MLTLPTIKRLASTVKPYFRVDSHDELEPYFDNHQNIAKSQLLFTSCRLEAVCDAKSVVQYINSIPDNPKRRQFVMFGRSNVGKSSLINSLLHRLEAAYVSKTPGKTQQLFFYKLNDPKKPIYLVDAPGYGFSSGASKKQMDSWRFLINTYLQSVYIQRALCLFDCEHGLKTTDIQLLKMLDKLMKNYMIVGTKSDKKDVDREQIKKAAAGFGMLTTYVHLTSSKKNEGINELRWHLTHLVDLPLTIIPK